MPSSYIYNCANTSEKISATRDRLLSTRLKLVRGVWNDPDLVQNLLAIQQSFNNDCFEMIKSAVGLDNAIQNGELSENMVEQANREIVSICCAIWDAELVPENYPLEMLVPELIREMCKSAKDYRDNSAERDI